MPRPTKYTEEKAAEIARSIAAGATKAVAADAAGVDPVTVLRWTKSNVGFAARIKAAEAQFEINHLGRIGIAAAAGTWQASAWLLERTRGERYAARQKVDNTHAGPAGASIPVSTTITFRRVGAPASAETEDADDKDTTPNGNEETSDDD